MNEAQEVYIDPDDIEYRKISVAQHMFTGEDYAVVCLNIDADVPWQILTLEDFEKHFKRIVK